MLRNVASSMLSGGAATDQHAARTAVATPRSVLSPLSLSPLMAARQLRPEAHHTLTGCWRLAEPSCGGHPVVRLLLALPVSIDVRTAQRTLGLHCRCGALAFTRCRGVNSTASLADSATLGLSRRNCRSMSSAAPQLALAVHTLWGLHRRQTDRAAASRPHHRRQQATALVATRELDRQELCRAVTGSPWSAHKLQSRPTAPDDRPLPCGSSCAPSRGMLCCVL